MSDVAKQINPDETSLKPVSRYAPRYQFRLSATICEVQNTITYHKMGGIMCTIALKLHDSIKDRVLPFSFDLTQNTKITQWFLGTSNFSLEDASLIVNNACMRVLGTTCNILVGVNQDGPDGDEFKLLSIVNN